MMITPRIIETQIKENRKIANIITKNNEEYFSAKRNFSQSGIFQFSRNNTKIIPISIYKN